MRFSTRAYPISGVSWRNTDSEAKLYLGLDIGTSAIKAIVADDSQKQIAAASIAIETQRPRDLWSEQDPEQWWRAVEAAVAILRRDLGERFRRIRGIGLSGQMHGAVVLDRDGKPLRPAILWNDGRSHAEARELARALPGIGMIAGVPPMAGFTAPKLLWLRKFEPEVFRNIAHVVLPKDYVRLRMTGSYATDMCDAAGSLFLDTGKRRWSPEIAAACGIDISVLPDALEGPMVSGHLALDVAAAWGLDGNIPVAAGAGDAAAGAIGIGAVNEGDAFISLGTSAQYFITRASYRPAPENLIHTFCLGLPSRWFQMAALLNGASCLGWVAELLGEADIGKLLDAAEHKAARPSPVLFLPYLTGERTPHNDPHARGVLFGLTASTRREDLVQAVLEGVAFALADCQAYLAATGTLPDEIGVIGGGSKSSSWMSILADVLGRTTLLYEGGETGPAFGAARLARMAVTGETAHEVCRKPAIARRFGPSPGLHEAYQPRLQLFKDLYRALRPCFHDL